MAANRLRKHVYFPAADKRTLAAEGAEQSDRICFEMAGRYRNDRELRRG